MACASDDYEEETPKETLGVLCEMSKLLAPSLSAQAFVPPAPNLAVHGVGNIALRLTKEGVGALRGAAELAPFGHGAETKVDEKVRQAWQIDAERIDWTFG